MTDTDLKVSLKWPEGWNLNRWTKHNVSKTMFLWNKEKVGCPIMGAEHKLMSLGNCLIMYMCVCLWSLSLNPRALLENTVIGRYIWLWKSPRVPLKQVSTCLKVKQTKHDLSVFIKFIWVSQQPGQVIYLVLTSPVCRQGSSLREVKIICSRLERDRTRVPFLTTYTRTLLN